MDKVYVTGSEAGLSLASGVLQVRAGAWAWASCAVAGFPQGRAPVCERWGWLLTRASMAAVQRALQSQPVAPLPPTHASPPPVRARTQELGASELEVRLLRRDVRTAVDVRTSSLAAASTSGRAGGDGGDGAAGTASPSGSTSTAPGGAGASSGSSRRRRPEVFALDRSMLSAARGMVEAAALSVAITSGVPVPDTESMDDNGSVWDSGMGSIDGSGEEVPRQVERRQPGGSHDDAVGGGGSNGSNGSTASALLSPGGIEAAAGDAHAGVVQQQQQQQR